MKTRLTFLLSILLLFCFTAYSQGPNLIVEGTANVTVIEDEDFSTGLGNYTNSGNVNWTLNNGTAYSGYVYNGQNATLERTITVPTGYTATLTFSRSIFLEQDPNSWYQPYYLFNINGIEQELYNDDSEGYYYYTEDTDYQSYLLNAGVNDLSWHVNPAFYSNNASIYAYIDNVKIEYRESTVQIVDGTEGNGKVLMSDDYGNASWRSFSEIGNYDNSNLTGLVPMILKGNTSYPLLTTKENNYGSGLYSNDNNTGLTITSNSTGISCSNNYGNGINSSYNGYYGIRCYGNETNQAYFGGNIEVTGAVNKGSSTFKIDHPLDPENKFLFHSIVESPDMMNVYNGNVVTNSDGIAVVQMPDYFETLNKEFRYQLTCIGQMSQVIVKEELNDGSFTIETEFPDVKVSWQITGIRQDPYANKNRVEVEVDKPEEYIGFYLHPEAYELPFEKGFEYVLNGHKTKEEYLKHTMQSKKGQPQKSEKENKTKQ